MNTIEIVSVGEIGTYPIIYTKEYNVIESVILYNSLKQEFEKYPYEIIVWLKDSEGTVNESFGTTKNKVSKMLQYLKETANS